MQSFSPFFIHLQDIYLLLRVALCTCCCYCIAKRLLEHTFHLGLFRLEIKLNI